MLCILLSAGLNVRAQSVSKCFRADWLQGERVVNLTVKGSDVTGTFTVVREEDEARPVSTYEFRGRLIGDSLRVAFVANKLPDVTPSEMKSLTWRLVKSRQGEILRIQFSGKNYVTNKYEVRYADFISCVEGYETSAKAARRVQFARGADSASFQLAFQTKSESQSFRLNLRAGQRIAVESPGCGISFFYPDKRSYEEGSAIDAWSADSLSQSGDYLFVIRPAADVRACSVTFKVTN